MGSRSLRWRRACFRSSWRSASRKSRPWSRAAAACATWQHNFSQTAVSANVEDYLAGLSETPDFILADPPRAGLGKVAVKASGADSRAAPDHRLVRSRHSSARSARLDRRELPHRKDHAGRPFPANIPPGNCGRTFRISSSARFSAIARPSSTGHSRSVDDSDRPPESNTCLGAGLKRPPVNCATERSRNSFDP